MDEFGERHSQQGEGGVKPQVILKIDVEGAECQVVRGAMQLFTKLVQLVFVVVEVQFLGAACKALMQKVFTSDLGLRMGPLLRDNVADTIDYVFYEPGAATRMGITETILGPEWT